MDQSDSCGFSPRLRVFRKTLLQRIRIQNIRESAILKILIHGLKKNIFHYSNFIFQRDTIFFLTIFILNIDRQKMIFLYEVCVMGVTSNPVLLIIPFTTMCDMIYKVSYLTRADLITFAEIVFQSSCNIWVKSYGNITHNQSLIMKSYLNR